MTAQSRVLGGSWGGLGGPGGGLGRGPRRKNPCGRGLGGSGTRVSVGGVKWSKNVSGYKKIRRLNVLNKKQTTINIYVLIVCGGSYLPFTY